MASNAPFLWSSPTRDVLIVAGRLCKTLCVVCLWCVGLISAIVVLDKLFNGKNKQARYDHQRDVREGDTAANYTHPVVFQTESIDEIVDKFPWLRRKNYLPNFFTRRNDKTGPPLKDYRNSTIMFVHNQKSGGTTTKVCMKCILDTMGRHPPKILGNGNARRYYNSLLSGEGDSNLTWGVYLGDSTFGLCDYTNKPCSYFTILRDPYERVISAYNMCRMIHPCQCRVRNANKMSINEWSLHQGSFFFRQLLANHDFFSEKYDSLVAKLRGRPDLKMGPYEVPAWWRNELILRYLMTAHEKSIILEYVLENLESWFTLIGLTDEYDLTFELIEHAYDLPFFTNCAGTQENAKYAYQDQPEMENKTRTEIINSLKSQLMSDPKVINALYYDLRIYEKAKEIFKRQKEAYMRNKLEK